MDNRTNSGTTFHRIAKRAHAAARSNHGSQGCYRLYHDVSGLTALPVINLLDRALRRLLDETGADAAVIWSARAHAPIASVLSTCPIDLLPSGAAWPAHEFGVPEPAPLSQAELRTILPPALLGALHVPPGAARSSRLGSELFLTLLWGSRPPSGEQPEALLDEIGYFAELHAESHFNAGEVERLRAVVNSLGDAVVTVDTLWGQASVNAAAAELLKLPQGKNPASGFRAALGDLVWRALNRDEIVVDLERLKSNPFADIHCALRFSQSPTHVTLVSKAVHQPGFIGRTWVFYDESALSQALESAEETRDLLRVSSDSMLDPQALLEAIRDPDGRITDFVYRDVNRATCAYLSMTRQQLIGHTLLETMPNVRPSGLLARYAECIANHEPLIIDGLPYHNQILSGTHYYDLRVNHAWGDCITVTWRDVTDRFVAAQRISESESRYKLLAENAGDVVMHVREGRITWISPSAEEVLGAPPEHWIGREVMTIIPEEVTWSGDDRVTLPRSRAISADGTTRWVHLHAKTFYDAEGNPDGYTSSLRIIDDEVLADERAREARRRQAEADNRYRRLMDNSAVPMCVTTPEGRFVEFNDAMCRYFGFDATVLRTKTWSELVAPEYVEADFTEYAAIIAGKIDTHRGIKEYFNAEGNRIWGDLSVSCLRKPTGEVESIIAQIIDITEQVQSQRRAEDAGRERAKADARYRRLMDNSAIGMAIVSIDGRYDVVNQALCDFLGYDAPTLTTMRWQDVTTGATLQRDLQNVRDVIAGRIESYRVTKQYRRADGGLVWGDLSVSCLRDPDGEFEYFVSQVIDITAEMEALEQIARRDQQNRALTGRLRSELDSAADYVRSILPTELEGSVRVSARYLPSHELGGDCYDYRWIDDDHLLVYIMDVSGHGIAPALLSVSVHNMLRSGSLPAVTLLTPCQTITELNKRFQMESQAENYFTMWYGVYEQSTRTLRYASAGHPPALLVNSRDGAAHVTELAEGGMPIGMFESGEFPCSSTTIEPGDQLLLYSDGAYELPTPIGECWSRDDFRQLCARVASAPNWSLDTLVGYLKARTTSGVFEDDCSLVRVTFD